MRYLYSTNALIIGYLKNNLEVRIFKSVKIEIETPPVLDMWFSKVYPGLGHRVKDPTKRWKI